MLYLNVTLITSRCNNGQSAMEQKNTKTRGFSPGSPAKWDLQGSGPQGQGWGPYLFWGGLPDNKKGNGPLPTLLRQWNMPLQCMCKEDEGHSKTDCHPCHMQRMRWFREVDGVGGWGMNIDYISMIPESYTMEKVQKKLSKDSTIIYLPPDLYTTIWQFMGDENAW